MSATAGIRTVPSGPTPPGGIAGVEVWQPRDVIADERGYVAKILWPQSRGMEHGAISEVYVSACVRGAVKGWHLHLHMTLRYVCLEGIALVVLYDDRPGSATAGQWQEVVLVPPPDRYDLLVVPPGVWNAYRVPPSAPPDVVRAVILNVPNLPHDPAEIVRLRPDAPGAPPWQEQWGAWRTAG